MNIIDFHIHTNHSFDSKAKMEEVCEAAIANGVTEICFTEHFSLNPVAPTYGHMNFEHYFEDINKCKQLFGHSLDIKAGIEICEPHQRREEYLTEFEPYEFDFVLGSVHNINDEKLRKFLKNKSNTTAYNEFFAEVYQMVSQADIDVIAHLDLLKRYAFTTIGHYNYEQCKLQLAAILEKAIARNVGIEINTSGLRSKLNETLPSIEILHLYKDLGGELITIGSDSHIAETVGTHFNEALQLVKACGFDCIYKYEKRKPVSLKITS